MRRTSSRLVKTKNGMWLGGALAFHSGLFFVTGGMLFGRRIATPRRGSFEDLPADQLPRLRNGKPFADLIQRLRLSTELS